MLPVVTLKDDGSQAVTIEDLAGPVSKLVVTDDGLRVQSCGHWGFLAWPDLAALVAPAQDLVAAQRAALVDALLSRPGVVAATSGGTIAEDSVW